MRLFELTEIDPVVTKLVAVSDQLKTDLTNGKKHHEMTTDKLISYLGKYDITVDRDQLYSMIKKPPLNHVISNIEGDKVIFKGFDEPAGDSNPNADKKKNVVKSMAKHAAK